MEREKEAFLRILPDLRKKYEGKYVAIKDGAVAGEDVLLGRNFLNRLNISLKGKKAEMELVDP